MKEKGLVRIAVASAAASVLALAVTSGGAGAAQQSAVVPNCVVANNLEAIIDDSGSMGFTDSSRFRVDLVNILAAFNPEKTMGAVEFGDAASALFGPFVIGPNLGTIRSQLNFVQADSGLTNYEAAFNLANAQNPGANARVFLSDGAPNEPDSTPDPAVWNVPKIKTYVVGFGSVDPAILQQIATDTGGPTPFNVTTASQLRTVAMILNARVNCLTDPLLITKVFGKQGQVKGLSFRPDGSTAEALIAWEGEETNITAIEFTQGGGAGKSVASIAKKKKGGAVKVKRSRGATYVTVTLKKLKPGKRVRFKLKAKKLAGTTTATAAIIP